MQKAEDRRRLITKDTQSKGQNYGNKGVFRAFNAKEGELSDGTNIA